MRLKHRLAGIQSRSFARFNWGWKDRCRPRDGSLKKRNDNAHRQRALIFYSQMLVVMTVPIAVPMIDTFSSELHSAAGHWDSRTWTEKNTRHRSAPFLLGELLNIGGGTYRAIRSVGRALARLVRMKDALEMRVINRIERLLLFLGLLLIAIYVAAYVHRTILSRLELRRFRDVQGQQRAQATSRFVFGTQIKLDVSLWSEKRIVAFDQSLAEHFDPPSAVLRIPKVHLEVPVLDGTDDLTLNRGVGHIVGTGLPGDDGNIGIAGHRDGFFRILKDVGPGDSIELETTKGVVTYVVDQIVVVRPDDVSVLRPRSRPSLTLVTCYPFYFVGSAPQRYIVEASVTESEVPFRQDSKQARSEPRNGLQQSTR